MGDSSEDFQDVLTAVQEGEFEVVQEVIGGRYVSVNALDQSGCSLLHWAAINNRVVIARLLIENGLVKAAPGGVLNESPLQWALRKKYYLMMELIYKQTQCDLSHKSKQGNDALHLACKLGDVNGAFLLLTWGANPDTTDNDGDTPLIWLIKNKPASSGTAQQELIKLLLRFGAAAAAQRPSDGNTALHVMVTTKVDLKTAFLVYEAAGPACKSIANNQGLNAYSMAVSTDNRDFARFLYDAMMFETLPYWTPIAAAAALTSGLFFCIQIFGIVYGGVYWLILYTAMAWTLLQWAVVEHRCRSTMGAFFAFALCQVVSFRYCVSQSVGPLFKFITLAAVLIWVTSMYFFMKRKPLSCAKGENRAQLAERIVLSAPTEGTDEECLLLDSEPGQETDNGDVNEELASAIGARFVKDSFTGKINRVQSHEHALSGPGSPRKSQNSHSSLTKGLSRGRGMGPKLCGCCLADRRIYVKAHTGEVTLPASTLVNYFLPPIAYSSNKSTVNSNTIVAAVTQASTRTRSSSVVGGGIAPGEVIAIATHCGFCNACVVDQDHHSIFLGNCVGKGNRRWYWLFLLMTSVFCFMYFLGAKYVQHYVTCSDDSTLRTSWFLWRLFRTEYCVLSRQGAFWLLSWMTSYAGTYAFLLLQVQVTSVARETTFNNVSKHRYESKPPPYRRRMRNVLTFLYSGLYNVTYPKNPRGRSDSSTPPLASSGSSKDITKTGAMGEPLSAADEKAQYEQAMRMLKNLDNKMSGGIEAGVPEGPPPATGKSATTTYVAPTEENLYQEDKNKATAKASECTHKGCNNCEAEETFSDYDTEFIESEQNNYATYYFHDSADEGETTPLVRSASKSAEAPKHVHSAACKHDHGHGSSNNGSSKNNGKNARLIGADERA